MLVGAVAAEHQMRVAVDQTGRHPGAAERHHFGCLEAGELGTLADPDHLAVLDADRAVADDSEGITGGRVHGRDVAVDQEAVPHGGIALGQRRCYRQSVGKWPNLAELLVARAGAAPVGLLGAPLAAGSVTAGSCDLAPALLRATLKRIGRYDVETGRELATQVADRGDVDVAGMTIEQATAPLRGAVRESTEAHALTLLVGGNNAITRPAVLGLGGEIEEIGLITLDAHFDMRDTAEGLSNGNPVRALLEDGLPGANVAQVGLASFANTAAMHEDAVDAGNLVITTPLLGPYWSGPAEVISPMSSGYLAAGGGGATDKPDPGSG